MTTGKKAAVVVLSGGQDSVTCLAVAVHQHGAENVAAISFDYGQRHVIELRCAVAACAELGVEHKLVSIPIIDSVSALVGANGGDVSQPHAEKPNLPASFVRNRNALFMVYAHAFAQDVGAREIYLGVCQTDYSGYPDCRLSFVTSMEVTLNSGYETRIRFTTPLMALTKAQTFQLAEDAGALALVLEHSSTCYLGEREQRHAWGYGCGTCPACALRARGYEEFAATHGETTGDAT